MNVLWLTREDPRPAFRGDLLYSIGLIGALARSGAHVRVVCIANGTPPNPLDTDVSYAHVPKQFRPRHAGIFSSLPSDAYRLGTLRFREAITAEIMTHAFSAVVIDNVAMGWSLSLVLKLRRATDKKFAIVYASHNHERSTRFEVATAYQDNIFVKAALYADAFRYAWLENRLLRDADLVSAITKEDAATMSQSMNVNKIVTLPPGYAGAVADKMPRLHDLPRRCIVVGSFGWVAKQENLRRFLDAAAVPFAAAGIELQIIGWAEPNFLTAMRKRAPFCEIVGPVQDISPYLRNARIGVVPELAGGGFKLKLLDYVFNGVPIATVDPRLPGMPDGFASCVVAESTPEELVKAIIAKIDRCDDLDSLRRGALSLCKGEAFDWSARGRTFHAAIDDTLSRLSIGKTRTRQVSS